MNAVNAEDLLDLIESMKRILGKTKRQAFGSAAFLFAWIVV